MPTHILVVDDEAAICELLETYLSSQGYNVSIAHSGAQMRQCLSANPIDLVLLDLGLPGEDGLSLARFLREHSKVGIIIVTGRGEPVDRVVGLEIGADDYVSKPFDLRELLARIRSVLRRMQPENKTGEPSSPGIRFSGWRLDMGARTLYTPAGEQVPLTTGEFELLVILVQNANRVLSRDQIMEQIYNREAGPFDRAVDMQVGRLRKKIEADPSNPELIKSVRGAGYIFTAKIEREK